MDFLGDWSKPEMVVILVGLMCECNYETPLAANGDVW